VKRLQRALLAFFVLLLTMVGKLQAQNSNIGTEFWTGYMDHVNGVTGTTGSQMNLYIAGDAATTVTISCSDGSFNSTVSVTPNTITTFAVPTTSFLGNTNGVQNKGIHIVSVKPVAVYAHIYASSVSGATLLLPVNTLANDYYSLNYTQLSNATAAAPAYSAFMVVATEDSTAVQITPSVKLNDGSVAGTAFTVTLQKGQIYQGLSTLDLTGTHIMSVSTASQNCKRIAVFSGSSKIKIGTPNATSDNLFQQVYPTAAWGKNYITIPLKVDNYDVMRVVVPDATTKITVNGSPITSAPISATLVSAGGAYYYEFNTQTTNVIVADKPCQVVQYAVTEGNKIDGTADKTATIGDPEMIYINPLEQNIDHVTLYSPYEFKILASYINVVIPTAAASSFVLDGVAPASGFTVVPNNTAYSYGQFPVSNTTHVISASQGFNAIAYGFGSAESYGYAAGTNVKNLNEFVQVVNEATSAIATTGCTNATYDPEVALPYQPLSLVWDLGNGVTPVTQTNPAHKDTISKNGTTLYVYDYGKPVSFAVGIYPIKVIATDPITTVCGATEEIDYNYTVVDPPQGKFSSRDTVCTADTVGFTDQTPVAVAVSKWHWDFGSGAVSDTSNVQNPIHKFAQPGTYTVSLIVSGSTGCNTSYSKEVYSRALPVANFTIPNPVCDSPLAVSFIDASVPSEGKLTSWFWDFGDGTTLLRTSSATFTHKYAAAQTYKVTLTVTTDKSCTASLPVSKYVNFAATPDFSLPDVCQADTYAHFTSKSTVQDSTSDPLTYSWNFGDSAPGNITALNPNTATGKIVQHHYSLVGIYNVKLTVTTNNGCISDTIKQLTVNGSNPRAAFTIVNRNNLCSNQLVSFITNASVPGFNQGKITSFTINFGDGSAIQTYRIDSGSVFTHKYPNEYVKPVTKYAVTMVAYSGASCSNIATDTASILPIPKTTFTPPDSVCQNLGQLQLASYISEPTGAPAGTPVFYIDGLRSPDGMFNTATLGAGTHNLICYYIVTATGCADTTKAKIKVEPVASVSAGRELLMLAGAYTQLKPTVIGGNNVKYLWSPATGLSDPTLLYPKASPAVTTVYTLTVTSTTDGLACPISDSVKVTVLQAPIVPNTFTPNGDGRNDTWYIKELANYPGCTVAVYNRNGERVFYSIGYSTPWDGRYNSVNLPVGTYYYIIDPKNGRDKMSGPVTIIR
jgi:gliding motility-associated-like protein